MKTNDSNISKYIIYKLYRKPSETEKTLNVTDETVIFSKIEQKFETIDWTESLSYLDIKSLIDQYRQTEINILSLKSPKRSRKLLDTAAEPQG